MRKVVLLLGLLAVWGAARAQEAKIVVQTYPAYAACVKQNETTMGMVDCANAEIARWDRRLNAAYQTIMASPRWNAATKGLLRDAQRAWVAYRPAKCSAGGELEYEGGTAARLSAAECMINETALRARELEGALVTH